MGALIFLALFAFFGVLLLGRKYFWIMTGTLVFGGLIAGLLEKVGVIH